MIGLIVFGVVFCIAVGLFGLWLLWRNINGVPIEKAIFKIKDTSIEGPVGAVMALAAIVVSAWLVSRYEPAVEAENKRLTAQNAEITRDLQETKNTRDDLEGKLRDEKAHSDMLANEIRAGTTEKKEAEAKLASAQDALAQAKANLTQTEQNLATTKEQVNDLSATNDELSKQLGDQTSQRKEAQQEALHAWQVADRISLTPAQQAEFNEIDKGVLDLNKGLTYLRIATAYWPRIAGKKAVATYEIYQKAFEADQKRPRGAGLFDFNSEEYKIKGDYNGRLAQVLQTQASALICEAARRAIVEGVLPSDAIRNMPPIRDYDMNSQLLATLGEFQYLRMRLQIMAGRAVILTRGYADGERTGWSQKLDPSFATVQLHENATPDAQPIEYALTFRPELTQVAIGKASTNGPIYGNTDLPNLRGEMAARIISLLVDDCPLNVPNFSPDTIPVQILEGQVYAQHSEIDRKARLHLLVFLKDQ